MDESLDTWFIREILVHEAALTRYLRRNWPHPQDILDLRQETYMRVYEAAGKSRPRLAKPFLFTAAKHLITDRIRRQHVVSIDSIGDLEALNLAVDDISPERRNVAHEELRLLAKAFDELPPRCRETVWMRRVEHVPQKEVATRLGVTPKTVEKHLVKGLRRLTDALFGNEVRPRTRDPGHAPEESLDEEHGHGTSPTD